MNFITLYACYEISRIRFPWHTTQRAPKKWFPRNYKIDKRSCWKRSSIIQKQPPKPRVNFIQFPRPVITKFNAKAIHPTLWIQPNLKPCFAQRCVYPRSVEGGGEGNIREPFSLLTRASKLSSNGCIRELLCGVRVGTRVCAERENVEPHERGIPSKRES